MTKTLIITSMIAPYTIPRYNAINNKIGGNLYVWYQTYLDINRHWNTFPKIEFKYSFLKGVPLRYVGKDVHTFQINHNLPTKLKELNPDHTIICGWDSFSSLYSVIWAKKNGKRITLWSGSTKYEKSWRRTITKPYVKWLIRNCDDYISYGTRSSQYISSLGANENKIKIFYNTVDIDYFICEYDKFKTRKDIIKKELGIKTKYIILFSGQIIERKGVYEMIDGFEKYKKVFQDISLLIIGNGLELDKLKDIVSKKNLDNIIFAGFLQKEELSRYYSIADIFTLPSREEVWGLVINEAMCFGLPILTTYQVGASVDLVKEGENGYIMKKNNGEEFFEGIKYIFDKGLIKKNNSMEIIKKFTINSILDDMKFEW